MNFLSSFLPKEGCYFVQKLTTNESAAMHILSREKGRVMCEAVFANAIVGMVVGVAVVVVVVVVVVVIRRVVFATVVMVIVAVFVVVAAFSVTSVE